VFGPPQFANPLANIFSGFKAPWETDSQPAFGSKQEEDDDRPSAKEWIQNWRANQAEANKPSAKEWIQNWRSKN